MDPMNNQIKKCVAISNQSHRKEVVIMRFQKEVQQRYLQVHQLAKRSVCKAERKRKEASPRELKYDMDKSATVDSIELGVVEIPVNQIVGTAVFGEKDLYSPDFMPVASANSPYAEQWCQIYMDYLSDEGWRSPIRCVEYMGHFYVLDGKKRVSVLKAHGAYTTDAIVTRMLPAKSHDPEVQRYYDFLEDYEKTGLYQVAFTQPGGLTKLHAALGFEEDHVWSDQDRYNFIFNLYSVEYALRIAYQGHLNITAADAMITLLEDYSYNEIRKMYPWDLTKVLQNSWVKLYKVLDADFEAVPGGMAKKAS